MNEIRIFQNEQFGQVRIAMDESNEPMFCLADVAKALGYVRPADAVTQHCKGVAILPTPTQNQYGAAVVQEMKYGKESEVYRLTMKSKLPDAEKFQDWVCGEVLPAIRKHGAYMTPKTLYQAMQNPDNLIQLLTALKSEQERAALLRAQNEASAREIQAMQPKAEYHDTVLRSTSLIATDVIAGELGITARKLNAFLCDNAIQFKRGGTYVLYSDMRGKGLEGYKTFPYTDPNTGIISTKKHMYWTEKGCRFIISLYHSTICKQLN